MALILIEFNIFSLPTKLILTILISFMIFFNYTNYLPYIKCRILYPLSNCWALRYAFSNHLQVYYEERSSLIIISIFLLLTFHQVKHQLQYWDWRIGKFSSRKMFIHDYIIHVLLINFTKNWLELLLWFKYLAALPITF